MTVVALSREGEGFSFLVGFEWPANSHRDLLEGGELHVTAGLQDGEAAALSLWWRGERLEVPCCMCPKY